MTVSAGEARATSSDVPLELVTLPSQAASGQSDIPGLGIRFANENVQFISVSRTLTSRGLEVEAPSNSEVALIDPVSLTLLQASGVDVASGYASVSKGGVLEFGRPPISLKPDVYAERIEVLLSTSELDAPPMQLNTFRYFEVTNQGCSEITAEAYSAATEEFVVGFDGALERKGGVTGVAAVVGGAL